MKKSKIQNFGDLKELLLALLKTNNFEICLQGKHINKQISKFRCFFKININAVIVSILIMEILKFLMSK